MAGAKEGAVKTAYHMGAAVRFFSVLSIMASFLPGLAVAESGGETPHRSAIKLERTGVMYYDVGHPSLAEPLLEEALTLREQSVGLDHLTVATTLSHLGSVYHALGKDDKAKMCLERALAIREKVLGSSHPAVSAIQSELHLLGEHHVSKVAE
jgi:tetratricopeptide (TPR) repeat protein